MRVLARHWMVFLAISTPLAACDGADSESADAGASRGGAATGGTGGSAGGTGGSAGGTGGEGGAGTGSVVVPPVSMTCDRQACTRCFDDSECHIVDNSCNDDPTCAPRQTEWFACVCAANRDAAAVAACDVLFTAAQPVKAPAIIQCVQSTCGMCRAQGTGEAPPADCQAAGNACSVRVGLDCSDASYACREDEACDAGLDGLGPCACAAQLGEGSVDVCVADFTSSGGAPADTVVACISGNCGEECGL